jgi:transcriptional regulator with XRE-family HTH domain
MKTSKIINVLKTSTNIRETRLKNNVSKEELSHALNDVSIELISKIEEGKFIPTLEYVFDFCEYFNIVLIAL